jgi:hypothetical protein
MKAKFFRLLLSTVTLTLLTLVASEYPDVAYADVTHCGTVGNDTWAVSANVHVVTCDVTVPVARTLTIEAGAIVKFTNDAQINVNGKLIAQGTSSNPIYFTSYYDDSIGGDTDGSGPTEGAVGDWGAIVFNGGSDDSSIITRAVIRYSGSDYLSYIDDGAIFLDNASPQLSHITFSDNYINGVEINDARWTTDTWDNTTVVYVIEEGDVSVPALNTLTITPGMKIKLGNDADIRVDGKLVAAGTPTDLIYFSSVFDDTLCGIGASDEGICDTHNDAATAPAVGNWGAIVFNGGSDDSSIITRAVIRYSGSDYLSYIDDGAIRLIDASPTISRTRLVNNYRGIEALNGSTPTLICNDIYNNSSYGIYNNTPATIVNAENQWWGDASGPTHSGNPSGTGQSVSDGVDYDPWATQPCTGTDPTNLQAFVASETQIDLLWQDNSSDESDFHIERSPNGSTNWTEIATVGANVTSYNNIQLSCSTTYYYRVRAYRQGDGQFSGYSNVVNATTYPCPPSSLSATAVSQAQINLSWQDNSPDETDFHIERSPNGSTGWIEITTVGINVTSYNNTGLMSNTTYFYRVRAHRHSDNAYSTFSNVASATTLPPGQGPPDPSNLQALPVSATQINLTWTDNSGDESNFRIERSLNESSGWTEIVTVAANATSYRNVGLASGTTYYYKVRAYRQSDETYSGYSNIASATTARAVYLPIVLK